MVPLFKKHLFLIGIVLTSLLPFIPFFISSDLLHTHDGLVHLPRLAAYFKALLDGNFPVRIAGYLNYDYGLPLFNFIYQTPYLVGSLFLLIGFSLVNAFKVSLLLSFVFSGIFAYLFGKEYFSDEKKGFLFAILYQFVPFRMVELLVRGSYGEVYTYTFLPLVLYGLALIQNKKIFKGILITAIAQALLILSHNSVSLLFAGASLLFLLVTSSGLRTTTVGIIGLAIGTLIAAFYWLPALMEHKYTYGNLYMENLYKDHFVPIQNFFIPNLTNSSSFQTEGITTFLGLIQIVAMVFALKLILSKKLDKKEKRIFITGFILMIISFFFMLPVSNFIWSSEYSSFLRQFQFPWRFLSLTVVACAFFAVSLISVNKKIKKNFYLLSIAGLSILSILYFFKTDLGYKKINQDYYWNFPLNTTYYGETDVIWSAGPAKEYPKSTIEIISGKGEVSNFVKKNHFQTFTMRSLDRVGVVSHTQYFPGWKAYVNGSEVPIQFQDANHRGLLVFDIPKGENKILVKFEENKLRVLSDIASVLGILLLVPIALFSKRYLK